MKFVFIAFVWVNVNNISALYPSGTGCDVSVRSARSTLSSGVDVLHDARDCYSLVKEIEGVTK